MAQRAPYEPRLLLASISDAANKGIVPSLPWWPGQAPTSFVQGGHAPCLANTPGTLQGLAPGTPEAATLPSMKPDEFKLHAAGYRRCQGPNHLGTHLQAALQGQEGSHPQHSLLSVLNLHILPFLAHVAVAQHHMVAQISERVRNLRPRNPFQRRNRSDHQGGSNSSQSTGPRPNRQAQRLYEQGRALERQLDPLGAADALMAAVQADPRHADWLTLLAKQWSDAGYLRGVEPATAIKYNQSAIETANKALSMAPEAAHPYIVRCVSRGRLALLSDNKTKVQLARDACDDAIKALELEPSNDLAHHLMGRWHYEMAGLNPLARTLVRLLFGTSLMQGSYQQALQHYRTATHLAPRTLVHHVELGRTLHKLGQKEEAALRLMEAVQMEVDDLNAHLQKLDAEQMLNQMLPPGQRKP